MPKKTTRSGAQRNRPKVQKNVSLVRPPAGAVAEETETRVDQVDQVEQEEVESGVEESSGGISTVTATATTTTTTTTPASTTTTGRRRPRTGRADAMVAPAPSTGVNESKEREAMSDEAAPKGSASARLAARRQNQRSQQRIAPTLITAEHYAYVRKDLVYIAILAILMFATIIILHFVPGIGL